MNILECSVSEFEHGCECEHYSKYRGEKLKGVILFLLYLTSLVVVAYVFMVVFTFPFSK